LFEKPELPLLDPSTLVPSLNPILVVDGAGLEKAKRFLAEPRAYVHDYETNRVESYYQRKARTFQFGNRNEQYIIDLLAFADGSEEKLWAAQGAYRREGVQLRKWWEKKTLEPDGQGGFKEGLETGFDLVPVNSKTLAPVVDVIRPSLESDAWLKIGYNLEFEYIVSKWCLGIRSWNFWDCFLMERLLHNGAVLATIKGFWALDDAVGRYFKFGIDKTEQTQFDLKTPLTESKIVYCALDVRLPWALREMQEPKIFQTQQGWTAQIENNAIPAFGDMHINGMWANPEKWQGIIDANIVELANQLAELDTHFIPLVGRKQLPDPERVAIAHAAFKACDKPTEEEITVGLQIKEAQKAKNPELKAQLEARRTELQEQRKQRKVEAKAYHKSISYLATAGYAKEVAKMDGEAAINYGAWQQVIKALHESNLGFDERNLPNLNAKTTLIKFMEMPIIKSYVKYKQVAKQLETYGYRWITPNNVIAKDSEEFGFVDKDTGRLHSRFSQLGTDTGRPSSTNPNLLNLPRERRFREAFEARPGYDMVAKDCSGQELRILCDYSHEPSWVDAFTTDKDVHSISARMFRKLLWDENALPDCAFFHDNFKKCKCPVHKKVRDRYKAVTLGVIMGKQAHSLGIEMGIPKEEAQALIDEWFAAFEYNRRAIEENQNSAYENREARTRSGRRRLIRQVSLKEGQEKAQEKFPNGYNSHQLGRVMDGMIAAVKREAGNVPYQGTGADLMKQAMGCGFDQDGIPYLWHIVRELEEKYGDDVVMLLNYVYDEFLYECREDLSEYMGGKDGIGGVVSDAIIRAGAEFVKIVPMASEGAIAKVWSK
jgi:DNA polymerase I-like protein with 3'-5' exonuclease and polymerase domains